MTNDPWKHRSKGMICMTCIWYVVEAVDSQKSLIGRCRRRAPTMTGYPAVYDTDWCGDHKVYETKLEVAE
jgi:hypothetical protein